MPLCFCSQSRSVFTVCQIAFGNRKATLEVCEPLGLFAVWKRLCLNPQLLHKLRILHCGSSLRMDVHLAFGWTYYKKHCKSHQPNFVLYVQQRPVATAFVITSEEVSRRNSSFIQTNGNFDETTQKSLPCVIWLSISFEKLNNYIQICLSTILARKHIRLVPYMREVMYLMW